MKGKEAVFYAKLHDKLSAIVPHVAARFSGVFAHVESPGDVSVKH